MSPDLPALIAMVLFTLASVAVVVCLFRRRLMVILWAVGMWHLSIALAVYTMTGMVPGGSLVASAVTLTFAWVLRRRVALRLHATRIPRPTYGPELKLRVAPEPAREP